MEQVANQPLAIIYSKFELDLYYTSPQAKGITYTEVTDGTPHTEASITEVL